MLGSIILGLAILFCIALFDRIIDTPEEIAYLVLNKIGEGKDTDSASANVISERLISLAKNKDYKNICIVSMSSIQMLSSICKSISDNCLSLSSLTYPDSYFTSLSDVNNSDGVIIALKSGKDNRKTLNQLVENLNIDNSNVLGYIWIN